MNLENKSISEILRVLNVRIMFQQNSNVRMEARIHKCVFLKVCPVPIMCLSFSNDCGRKIPYPVIQRLGYQYER